MLHVFHNQPCLPWIKLGTFITILAPLSISNLFKLIWISWGGACWPCWWTWPFCLGIPLPSHGSSTWGSNCPPNFLGGLARHFMPNSLYWVPKFSQTRPSKPWLIGLTNWHSKPGLIGLSSNFLGWRFHRHSIPSLSTYRSTLTILNLQNKLHWLICWSLATLHCLRWCLNRF